MRTDASAESGMDFYSAPATIDAEAGNADLSGRIAPAGGATSAAGEPSFNLPDNAATSMVTTLLRGSYEQASARGFFDLYGQIDALRPMFDVETDEVRQRLVWSFHPKKGGMLMKQYDLYCPLMLAFTLSALLVMGMKGAHPHMAAESTLIGTAFAAAFTTWLLGAVAVYAVAQLTRARARPAQVGCAAGYALAGVCMPLTAALLPSSAPFYLSLVLLGGASAASLARTVAALAEPADGMGHLVGVAPGLFFLAATLFLRWRYFMAAAADPPLE